jgi:hypothetical protein
MESRSPCSAANVKKQLHEALCLDTTTYLCNFKSAPLSDAEETTQKYKELCKVHQTLTMTPDFATTKAPSAAFLEVSLHVAGSVVVSQAPKRWHNRPARFPLFMPPGASMAALIAAHLVASAPACLPHHAVTASATAGAVVANLMDSVRRLAASKQSLQTAQGVRLQAPTDKQKSVPPSQ